MVDIAQLVRVPGCGPGGRGFESHYSPHFSSQSKIPSGGRFTLGCSQAVRHGTLTPAFVGSNPATPAKNFQKRFLFLKFFLDASAGFEGRQAKLVLRRAADSTADLTAIAFAVNRARRTRRKSCHPSHIIWSISSVGRARDF